MKKKYLYIISIVVILLLIIGYNIIQPNSGKMLCIYSNKGVQFHAKEDWCSQTSEHPYGERTGGAEGRKGKGPRR